MHSKTMTHLLKSTLYRLGTSLGNVEWLIHHTFYWLVSYFLGFFVGIGWGYKCSCGHILAHHSNDGSTCTLLFFGALCTSYIRFLFTFFIVCICFRILQVILLGGSCYWYCKMDIIEYRANGVPLYIYVWTPLLRALLFISMLEHQYVVALPSSIYLLPQYSYLNIVSDI